jgi:hypothetical protein
MIHDRNPAHFSPFPLEYRGSGYSYRHCLMRTCGEAEAERTVSGRAMRTTMSPLVAA